MSFKFSTYTLNTSISKVEFVFIPSRSLPDLPISTPFTFPKYGTKYMLSLDKMGWWNPLGGHIDSNESWEQALVREAYEEAGVTIKDITVFGYVLATTIEKTAETKYPERCILPFTYSNIINIDSNWTPRETTCRSLLYVEEILEKLKLRDDSNQMYEIFSYLQNI